MRGFHLDPRRFLFRSPQECFEVSHNARNSSALSRLLLPRGLCAAGKRRSYSFLGQLCNSRRCSTGIGQRYGTGLSGVPHPSHRGQCRLHSALQVEAGPEEDFWHPRYKALFVDAAGTLIEPTEPAAEVVLDWTHLPFFDKGGVSVENHTS
jgi:hypothetical protein